MKKLKKELFDGHKKFTYGKSRERLGDNESKSLIQTGNNLHNLQGKTNQNLLRKKAAKTIESAVVNQMVSRNNTTNHASTVLY